MPLYCINTSYLMGNMLFGLAQPVPQNVRKQLLEQAPAGPVVVAQSTFFLSRTRNIIASFHLVHVHSDAFPSAIYVL